MSRWPGHARSYLAIGVTGNLLSLGFFKYYGFFVSSLGDALRPFGIEQPLPLLDLVVPVGISFFTFEAIAYLIELKRGGGRPPAFARVGNASDLSRS